MPKPFSEIWRKIKVSESEGIQCESDREGAAAKR